MRTPMKHFILLLCIFLALATTSLAKDTTDYYKIFDMSRSTFDKDRLHKAYRKLAKQHHPDKNPGSKEAQDKFVEITKAFEVLNDEQKRRIYDQFGAEAVDKQTNGGGGGHYDFHHAEDIFNSFFGGGGGGSMFDDLFGFGGRGGGHHQQQRTRRSPDAKLEMSAPLEAFYKGETIKVEVQRQQLCQTCNGTGAKNPDDVKGCQTCRGSGMETVIQQIAPGFVQQTRRPCSKCQGKGKIFKDKCGKCSGARMFNGPTEIQVALEAGMPDGAMLKFPKMSDEHPDAEPGDLYVVVRQEPHDRFKRNGQDLYVDVTLTLSEALLGFTKELEHLDGHKVKLARSTVVQPDSVETVKGEGMPGGRSGGGSLYVKYKVVLPTSLSSQQATLMKQALKPSFKEEL